jgi:hypothetical protein
MRSNHELKAMVFLAIGVHLRQVSPAHYPSASLRPPCFSRGVSILLVTLTGQLSHALRTLAVIIAATVLAVAQINSLQKERPLALVLKASGVELRRANSALPLAAAPGDVLFAGDRL